MISNAARLRALRRTRLRDARVRDDHAWWTGGGEFDYTRSDGALIFDSCEGGGCDFKSPTRLDDGAPKVASTFVRAGEETIDGTPEIHLRSESGMRHELDGRVPGTWDLWIGGPDGYLLRQTFHGHGSSSAPWSSTASTDPTISPAKPKD